FLVAISLAAPTSPTLCRAEAPRCAAPNIEVASLPGGLVRFNIQSACRKGELVIGRYGHLVMMERLDANGNLAFQVDCFLGDREIDLAFVGDWHATDRSCSQVENGLSKVAIVWRDHVDLDLHAFEYSASPGSDYDRSARNPGSYQTAQSEYSRSGRSHGFM